MRVALIQPNSKKEKYELISSVISLIERASLCNCEIACLPEHWIFAKDFNKILDRLVKVSRENRIAILTGGCYVEYQNFREVVCYAVNSYGEIIGKQEKIHLYEAEKEVALAGNEYKIFEINNCKIGIAICYDLVFPEAIRILVLKGAEIIFVPSRIRKISYEGWKIYALSRALENRVHLACPITYLPPEFPGKSFVVDFEIINDNAILPKIGKVAEENETILIYDFDLKKLEKFRKERLSNRRPETYHFLIQK